MSKVIRLRKTEEDLEDQKRRIFNALLRINSLLIEIVRRDNAKKNF